MLEAAGDLSHIHNRGHLVVLIAALGPGATLLVQNLISGGGTALASGSGAEIDLTEAVFLDDTLKTSGTGARIVASAAFSVASPSRKARSSRSRMTALRNCWSRPLAPVR